MAIFPDRIVLKNSTDDQAVIETAIGSGGSDPINQGEVVLGLEDGSASLYTLDSNGNVVTISGSGGGGSGGEGGGRGDGGDFDAGTVNVSFVFGVYGGGDFNAPSDDIPVELLGTDAGPDGGTF